MPTRQPGGLAELVNNEFRRRLELEFGTVSRLELEYEKQYNPLFSGPRCGRVPKGPASATSVDWLKRERSSFGGWSRYGRTGPSWRGDFQRELFRRFFDECEIPRLADRVCEGGSGGEL